jgi:hypothetical protein
LNTQVYLRYTLISTNFTFEFIQRPISPILSPSSRTFVELTLVKDDCKIEISLVAVHVIYVVMVCNHCFSSAKFSYLTFSSVSAIGDALSYNDYT